MLLDHIDWCRAATLYAPVLFSSLQLCGGCSSCAANYAVSSCEAVERWRPCRQLSEPRHYQTPERESVCVCDYRVQRRKKKGEWQSLFVDHQQLLYWSHCSSLGIAGSLIYISWWTPHRADTQSGEGGGGTPVSFAKCAPQKLIILAAVGIFCPWAIASVYRWWAYKLPWPCSYDTATTTFTEKEKKNKEHWIAKEKGEY